VTLLRDLIRSNEISDFSEYQLLLVSSRARGGASRDKTISDFILLFPTSFFHFVLADRIPIQTSSAECNEHSRAHLRSARTFPYGKRSGARRNESQTEHKGGSTGFCYTLRKPKKRTDRVDSPACTWQSKEAINHQDNASPPLSEPRSLGWKALLVADEAARERRRKRQRGREREEEYERRRRRRSTQKVNRLLRLVESY